jgi:hypothetical protein
MKPLAVTSVTAIAIAAGVAVTQSKAVLGFIAVIYPVNPARREAFSRCVLENRNFNRLDPTARDMCYQHALVTPTVRATPVLTASAPNQVELRQAAGRAGAPRDDARILRQSNGAMR